MAHDLRTPLTSIKGFAQLMLRQRRNQPDDSVTDGLRTIIAEVDRLDEMTASLLDVSRVRVGRVPMLPVPVDVTSVVQRAILELGSVATLSIDAESAPVLGDAKRIGQIVRAVASYLTKRTGGGNVVTRVTSTLNSVNVVIEDDGEPLQPQTTERLLHRLLEPAEHATSGWRVSQLELYIARGLAEAHGGALLVESPLEGTERGIRFTLTLPSAR